MTPLRKDHKQLGGSMGCVNREPIGIPKEGMCFFTILHKLGMPRHATACHGLPWQAMTNQSLKIIIKEGSLG